MLPQPKFDGVAERWGDFKRRWRVWWPLQKLGEEYEAFVLLNSLMEKDADLYLGHVERGMGSTELWEALEKRSICEACVTTQVKTSCG